MSRTPHTLLATLTLASCAANADVRPALSPAAGESVPKRLTTAATPAADVLALDDAMRAFVREHTTGARTKEARMQQLLAGMKQHGLFELDYAATLTRTARDTFRERMGNCLSFTMLFVALAREAGIDAQFQMVDMPPVWSSQGDVVIVTTHINVLVRVGAGREFIVDFNTVDSRSNYRRRTVSDRYALALFYSNRGAETYLEEHYESSLAYLLAATDTFPDIADLWVNLGLLYARLDLPRRAEEAYLRALDADRDNGSALTNLANLHAAAGRDDLAEPLRVRIRRHQERNPYYHFSLARAASEQQRLDDALRHLDRAIRLKRDEHQFHHLRALVYQQLGQLRNAERSLIRARDRAQYADVRDRYASELEMLAQH
jgi:tetratricopeptide (TPR) repeat protein